jgi:subtilase family serine protease
MRILRTTSLMFAALLFCLLSTSFGFAATGTLADCRSVSVTGTVDENVLTPLEGNVHPLARAEFDQGKVSDSLPLEHVIMLLKRSPEQEIALETRIDQMHNQQSPLYKQWLNASQMGTCYGAADADIAAVSAWLQKHGFTVDYVPASKTMLIFTGTAGQVAEAFHTEIHNLNVRGEKHIANMSAPEVPAGLAPVIAGFRSLHDFFPNPMSHVVGVTKRDPSTGKAYLAKDYNKLPTAGQALASRKANPLITYTNNPLCLPNDCEWLGPQDFYTIYNERPLLTGNFCNGRACDGTGQTIAVIEETDVCAGQSGTSPDDCAGANDLAAFRSQFGLPAPHANYFFGVPGYCADPGVQGPNGTGEESEADIDLQWSGSVAPGATVDFIACASTATSGGVDLSAIYAVNNLNNTVSSFSVSYGVCEAELPLNEFPFIFGTNAFYNKLWQQAVAEGQTVNISAGDSGDDTCDRGAIAATSGWNVNGLASTPYNVAAGGTDFTDNYTSNFAPAPNSYWNTNDSTPYGSALSYIPEVTWNQTCGSTLLTSYLGFLEDTTYTPEQVCNGDTPFGSGFTFVNASGSGGISSIYRLPTWQSVYGVGRDNTSRSMRNLPDISLFASANFWNHLLVFCESDILTGIGGGLPCNYSNVDEGGAYGAGGTSFVAPEFNGVIALINQASSRHGGPPARQGQADYKLYAMADLEYGVPFLPNFLPFFPSLITCESNYLSIAEFSHVFPSCVFYDIYRTPVINTTSCSGYNNTACVVDGNEMPCVTGSTDCFTATSGDAYGLLSISTSTFEPAWYQSAGYSDAVGLGSFNIANLVNDWNNIFWNSSFASTTTVSASEGTIQGAVSAKSTTLTATVIATGRGRLAPPMGTVDFYASTNNSSGLLDCRSAEHLNRLGTAALVPASRCTAGCYATAVLSGVTAAQLGGPGSHDVLACFGGDGANDAASSGTASVTMHQD